VTHRYRQYVFWLACGATMCLAIAANLPPVFLTTFAEAFGGSGGLSEEQLGRISALVFAGFVAGIAIASPFADRLGAKPFVLFGLASLAVGLGLLGMAQTYGALLAAVFLLGFGAGVLEVVMSPVVAALQPHRRAAALNWLHAAYSLGAVGTVLIGSSALHFGVPWRTATLAIIAVPACVLVGFATVRNLPLVHDDGVCEPVRSLLHHKYLWAAFALIALGGGVEIGIAQWLPAYAERNLGYSKAAAGIALAAFSVAMLVGRVVIGHWVLRVRAVNLMVACCAACLVLLMVASFAPARVMALGACIVLGFGVSCFWPTTLSLAGDRYPRGGASMFGLLAAFGNVGCMTVPWIVGLVAERSSLAIGIATIAICPATMVVLLVAIRRRSN